MRALTRWVLLAMVVMIGGAFGQQPPEKQNPDKQDAGKRSLDDLLATALKHSPDVQVAQAKVREAEAERRRTRLTLLQRVIEANAAVEANRAMVGHAEAVFKRISSLFKTGQVSSEEMQKAEAQLVAAKAQLAQ